MVMPGGGDGILCGVVRQYAGTSFLLCWVIVAFFSYLSVAGFSGTCFYKLYWPSQVTYEKWMWKSNPKFPTPEKVRDELVQTCKAVWCAALCPALAFWLYARGDEAPVPFKGFCGTTPEYGWGYNLACFFIFWLGSDFYEFSYHYIGHRFACMWNWHRHHHVFFNPTPFAVVADEFADQFARSLPLVLFPLLMPCNLDVLFGVFMLLFYGTGVYHHCGYEVRWPNAHTGFFNTSYHHYLHHSISIKSKPYHCGFMFQAWDQMFGSIYHGKCFCVQCQQAEGKRSRELFDQVALQDYTVLLKPSFWVSGNLLACFTGTSGEDTNEELMSQKEDETVMKVAKVMNEKKSTPTHVAKARGAAAMATMASTAT